MGFLVVVFQYHTGPIKRIILSGGKHFSKLGFNTTLVQLKEWLDFDDMLWRESFQYHTGPIKRT